MADKERGGSVGRRAASAFNVPTRTMVALATIVAGFTLGITLATPGLTAAGTMSRPLPGAASPVPAGPAIGPTPTMIAGQSDESVAYQIDVAHTGTVTTSVSLPLWPIWSVKLSGA